MERRARPFLSVAKITRPKTVGMLPRRRLFDLLDRSTAALIWITGPPGSGKTILAASYVEYTGRPCVWLRLDRGDSDPATFCLHLTQAAVSSGIPVRKSVPTFLPEHTSNLTGFFRLYCRALFHRLPKGVLIVLDDIHEAQESPVVSQCLPRLVEEAPPGAAILTMGRQALPGPLLRNLVAGRIAEIDAAALAFTLNETRSILAQAGHATGDQITARIHALTRGWAAGLVLYSTLLRQQAIATSDLTLQGMPPERIQEYFNEEVIKTLPSADVNRFVRTAWLPWLTKELVMELTGSRETWKGLEQLARRGLFVSKHRDAAVQYRYHPLLQRILRSLAEQRLPASQVAALWRRSAEAIERAGDPAGAIELRLEERDFEGAEEVILKIAPLLFEQARVITLQRWLGTFTPKLLQRKPWLQYWRGMAMLVSQPAQGLPWFEQAFAQFKRSEDLMGMACACCGAMEAILIDWQDFRRLDRWITRFSPLYERWSSTVPPDFALRGAAAMLGSLLWRCPQHQRLTPWVRRTTTLLSQALNPGLVAQGLSQLFCFYLWQGDFGKAQQLGMMIESTQESDRTQLPVWTITWKMYHAVWCWHTGRFAKCDEAVALALALADETGVHVADHQVISQGVYAALLDGNIARADHYLKQFSAVLNPAHDLMVGHYQHLLAWAAWLKGDLPEADHQLMLAYQTAVRAGAPFPMVMNHYAGALLAHEQGKRHEAFRQIECALTIGRQMRSRILESMGLLGRAYLVLDRQEPPETSASRSRPYRRDRQGALDDLARGLALSRELDMIGHSWRNPRVMSRLCAVALETGIEIPYVQQLIRRTRLSPPESALHLSEWPWPVRIFTLGRFGLTVDGRVPPRGRKTQKKPIELLKALIAFGGRQVGEDRLADALWPDLEGPSARDALFITIRRARLMLGNKEAIRHQGGKLTLESDVCWVDAWAFERLLNRAGSTNVPLDAPLALYQGGFLADDPGVPWAESMRDRLRRLFLSAVEQRGDQREREKAWEEAIRLYERGLAEDPLSEECYRRAMLCHHKSDCVAEAQALYRRCRTMLASLQGRAPSLSTIALAQRLGLQ